MQGLHLSLQILGIGESRMASMARRSDGQMTLRLDQQAVLLQEHRASMHSRQMSGEVSQMMRQLL